MTDELPEEWKRQALIRAMRQHLESLARAGLDRVPAAPSLEQSLPIGQHRRAGAGSSAPGPITAGHVPSRAQTEGGVAPQPGASVSGGSTAVASRPAAVNKGSGQPVVPPGASLAVLFGATGFDQPPSPVCDRAALLATVAGEVAGCRRCPHLADTRTQTVFGTGKSDARLMFIGEAPGADEDRLGQPFVGRAGQLLTDMITKGMGLTRDDVFIANVLKCRPPQNRTPSPEESNNCFSYLEQQISIIRPEFLCLLGRVAAQAVLDTNQAMKSLRGQWHRYRGIPTLVTYHPSYLLRTPSAKKDSWEDLQMLMKEMGLARPSGRQQTE